MKNRREKNKEVKKKKMNRKRVKRLFEDTQTVSPIGALCFIAILAISVLVVPVCAQSGNLGHNPAYPELQQKEFTPDYLLVGEVDVTVDAGAKEATLQFDTRIATPKARVYYGLYVPQQEIKVPQYRRDAIEDLVGENTAHSVSINIGKFESSRYDICNFEEDGGVICYRIELYNPEKATSVFYDGRFRVDGNYNLVPCVTEGPFVDLVTTDSAVISWETDVPTTAAVEIDSKSYTDDVSSTHHEIAISGLAPNTEYEYDVLFDSVKDIKTYKFKTAPTAASTKFEFALMSDSRAGVGGGEQSFAGVNYHKLSRFMSDAYNNGADVILFGGDLVNGYTTSLEDYRMQLKAWKDATEHIGCYIPIYEGMGNHEAVMDAYDDGSKYGIEFDKQDADGDKSAETIFAEEFVSPANSFPDPENTSAPSYEENVYYFDYGNTRFIAFNTNYWWCNYPEDFGGNLEGYVMDNQLEWIRNVLDDTKNSPSIEHVFMFAHEPAFPNGGHLQDAQWYNGGDPAKNKDYEGNPLDRAYVVERRDELWEAISQNGKVVAVFFGDEHNYNRMCVDSETPAHLDGSANANFTNSVWQIISGGAGAPFYAQQETPWSGDVEVFYPSKHYCMVSVDGDKVSLKTISDSGEIVDEHVL